SSTEANEMRQSKSEVYLHLVWATLGREAFITSQIERAVYRCIGNEAHRLRCAVLAIDGMPDHVHLCVKMPLGLTVMKLMNQVKGVSSHFVHDQLSPDLPFRWQEGYSAFSVGPNQVKHILAYIENQKQHHRDNTLQSRWEETDEEYQPMALRRQSPP
ncbi:MAG: IS200/IS605 family transposase, partial [Janthinobacterium lividum]